MKNIHLIPTDKPSRLWMTKLDNLTRCHDIKPIKEALGNNVNIYITSSNDIGVGDYYYLPRVNSIYKCIEDAAGLNLERRLGVGKIVLTTDPELINDGVQAIDDEFLNWFINNPGCDYVKVVLNEVSYFIEDNIYRIVIPKEEPKQTDENGKPLTYWGGLAEHKQETLEEFIEKEGYPKGVTQEIWEQGVREGAKWQQNRSYSDDEVLELLLKMNDWPTTFVSEEEVKEWFEQFKKK